MSAADRDHLAVELRRRSPLKAENCTTAGWLIWTWSMSCGATLASMTRCVGLGHDQHQHLAGLDHAADRMHRALEDRAVLGCNEVDALELVLGRHRRSLISARFARISPRSLPTSVRRSSSICRILSWISAMRPLACAMEATSAPRSRACAPNRAPGSSPG